LDKVTLLVLALAGLLGVSLWAAEKLAGEVERCVAAWIGTYRRLRDLLRQNGGDGGGNSS